MTLVSLTTVFSFEVVGAVLVVGFLIIPPATAQLFSTKLKQMLFWASLFGILAVIIGHYLAVWMNVSITGAMVTVAGINFFVVLIIQRLVDRKKRSTTFAPPEFITPIPKNSGE
jgi:manganese/zinc/iron transport system permease protein